MAICHFEDGEGAERIHLYLQRYILWMEGELDQYRVQWRALPSAVLKLRVPLLGSHNSFQIRLIPFHVEAKSRDSSVGIAAGYGLDDRGIRVRVAIGSSIFSSPRRSDRLWCPPSFLSNRYRGLFSRG
jgi:hypothetical protein